MARLFRPEVISLLSVRGRTTGLWRSVPVAVLDVDGQPYLVSAYGDTEWSRNLRAAGTGSLTRRGHVEGFTAVEVPTGEVGPLIEDYLRQFGRLPTVARTFRLLPDPCDHPTFRLSFNSIDR
jgi:deazaflavin-dependent oxidoreductase (nitroreductase family)